MSLSAFEISATRVSRQLDRKSTVTGVTSSNPVLDKDGARGRTASRSAKLRTVRESRRFGAQQK